jgi:MoxR-like ATPase
VTLEAEIESFCEKADRLRTEIERVVVGHEEALTEILVALFAGGHALLQGVPGLGKTLLVRTLARCLTLSFGRIQCTPDLMPADILGTTVVRERDDGQREFRFERGPVFAHVLLADEVNRATPKTQSALLEAMQESGVTVGGERHGLPSPFLLLATQNPIEMEGTYPLPEAQLDRFLFMVLLESPDVSEIVEVVRRTTGSEEAEPAAVLTAEEILTVRTLARRVALAEPVAEYAARIVRATHPDAAEAPSSVARFLRYGASPRAAQALALAGRVSALLDRRANVAFEDVRRFAPPALRHRLIMNFEGEAEGVAPDDIVGEVLEAVREP